MVGSVSMVCFKHTERFENLWTKKAIWIFDSSAIESFDEDKKKFTSNIFDMNLIQSRLELNCKVTLALDFVDFENLKFLN